MTRPLTRTARAAIAVSMILATAVAILSHATREESIPFGSSTIVTVSETPDSTSTADDSRQIEIAAIANHTNLARITPDYTRNGAGRIVCPFIGDPHAFEELFPGGIYPTFSPDNPTRFGRCNEISVTDARGFYAVFGNAGNARALIDDLARVGIRAEHEPIDETYILGALVGSPIWVAITSLLLGLTLALAYSVANQRELVAVQDIHGLSRCRLYFRDLCRLVIEILVMALVVFGASAGLLYLYNGLNQWPDLLRLTLACMALDTALIILVRAVFVICQPRDNAASSITGDRPDKQLRALSAVVAVLVLANSYGATFTVSAQLASLTGHAADLEHWNASRDLFAVRFSPSTTPEDFQSSSPAFGALFRAQSQAGTSFLAYSPDGAGHEGQMDVPTPTTGNTLLVSNEYLERQIVVDVNGQRFRAADSNRRGVDLIIPENRRDEESQIATAYREFFRFQQSLRSDAKSAGIGRIRILYLKAGQRLFNYADASLEMTSQVDPVIAVVGKDSAALSDDFYVAAASSHRVLFADRGSLSRDISHFGLADTIAATYRASSTALQEIATTRSDISYRIGVLAIILIIAAASLTTVIETHCAIQRQRLMAASALGTSFLRIHGALLATFGALQAVILGVMTVLARDPMSGLLVNGIFAVGLVTFAAFRLDRSTSLLATSLDKRR